MTIKTGFILANHAKLCIKDEILTYHRASFRKLSDKNINAWAKQRGCGIKKERLIKNGLYKAKIYHFSEIIKLCDEIALLKKWLLKEGMEV